MASTVSFNSSSSVTKALNTHLLADLRIGGRDKKSGAAFRQGITSSLAFRQSIRSDRLTDPSTAGAAGATAPKGFAAGALAARDMTKSSSRSLTLPEKQIVRAALENAKVRLERTELALQGNWLNRIPGLNLTNKEVFRQYFGDNTEAMRPEILARVQRVRAKVDTMLGQNIGNTVVRATGRLSDYSAYINVNGTEKISIGDRFFSFRSASREKMNSQAGVFVHELSHVVQYNSRKSIDQVPGYAYDDKQMYSEKALKKLANTRPDLAIRNANLFMWYVERQK